MVRLSPNTIKLLQADRLEGTSLPKLVQKYNLPKTTIWHHVKDITLSEQLIKKMHTEQGGSKKRREENVLRAQNQAGDFFRVIKRKHIWASVFAALYWSEGSKREFVFTNTDANMVRVFVSILKKELRISSKDLDVWVRIGEGGKAKEATIFWSGVVGVPLQSVRLNDDKRNNTTKSPYGICRIRLKKGSYYLKLAKSMSEEIIRVLMTEGPCSSMDRTSHS